MNRKNLERRIKETISLVITDFTEPSSGQGFKETNRANVGDLIMSKEFAYGYYDYYYDSRRQILVPKKSIINVDGRTKTHPLKYESGIRDVRLNQSKWRRIKPEYDTTDLGAYDTSRGYARFAVIGAHWQGGGPGYGGYDWADHGWYVTARRLHKNGNYNPRGEQIQFYQCGYFPNVISRVELVGRMEQVFVKK